MLSCTILSLLSFFAASPRVSFASGHFTWPPPMAAAENGTIIPKASVTREGTAAVARSPQAYANREATA